MAKHSNKIDNYSEADLMEMLGLNRLKGNEAHSLMKTWMKTPEMRFDIGEKMIFDSILQDAIDKIDTWHEEDLKMLFIAFVIRLGHLQNNGKYNVYFERTISAIVNGHFLKTKTDFMMARGVLDKPQKPYFHFQEWKPQKRPTGDSMAQLVEAMLIAQALNQNEKAIYGCEVVGKYWSFVILKDLTYCISDTYDCTKNDDLLHIIAVLRHFKHILDTTLLA